MALSFSKVTATANDSLATFLVAGIPQKSADLRGWTAFEDFLATIDGHATIRIHTDAYIYGEGDVFIATPEEVAYFMNRLRIRGDFLESRCEHYETIDFDV